MIKILAAIIVWLIITAILYLLWSFGCWTFDVVKWGTFARLLFAIVSGIVLLFLIVDND